MIYAKYWTKVHKVPHAEANSKLRDIKFDEDLKVIKHFDNMFMEYKKNQNGEDNDDDKYGKKDSESSDDEDFDAIDVLNRQLEKMNSNNLSVIKKVKKVNPYTHAQNEFKKSRIISKRLNTLSIFVKKDIENKQADFMFDDPDKETGRGNFSKY